MIPLNNNGSIQAFMYDNELVVDSRLIAKKLELDHHDWFNNIIKTYQTEVEQAFGVVRFKNSKPQKGSKGGRPEKYALLNEDQSFFYMTTSRNTPAVIQCKIELVKAFSKAKQTPSKLLSRERSLAIEDWILDKPRPWDEHFFSGWRKEAERLTGWSWNWQCMANFINSAVYVWLPSGVLERLDQVNPTDDDGRRARKQHQYFTDDADSQILKDYIRAAHELMTVSGSKDEFLRNIRARHTKAIQPWLF